MFIYKNKAYTDITEFMNTTEFYNLFEELWIIILEAIEWVLNHY